MKKQMDWPTHSQLTLLMHLWSQMILSTVQLRLNYQQNRHVLNSQSQRHLHLQWNCRSNRIVLSNNRCQHLVLQGWTPVVEGSQPVPTPVPPGITEEVSNVPLPNLTARPEPEPKPIEAKPQVDLAAAAALDAASRVSINNGMDSNSNSIANQDIEWYNKGVGLIEDKKYREALSCFDRALPSFADDDEMVIRILNGRGNALYYLEDYPKCVESYHKAMVINPKEFR